MFDYILTGPILRRFRGTVHAGLINETFAAADAHGWIPPRHAHDVSWHAAYRRKPTLRPAFAVLVTLYYWWQNLKGIEESSDKALRVMQITTVHGRHSAGVGDLHRAAYWGTPAAASDS